MRSTIFYIVFLVLLIFSNCSYELEFVEEPDDLIPKDTFELVLEDMMLLEAYVKTQKSNVHEYYKSMPKSAELIFEEYSIDSSRYINSMDYYSQKQEILLEMYSNIQDRVVIDAVEVEEQE
ncbi:MAG: hypothetical protein COA32_10930 [Fluviicola sp.]|nr:MAG: hypothetical protein COA32_10930 [Fluviicola sp.]